MFLGLKCAARASNRGDEELLCLGQALGEFAWNLVARQRVLDRMKCDQRIAIGIFPNQNAKRQVQSGCRVCLHDWRTAAGLPPAFLYEVTPDTRVLTEVDSARFVRDFVDVLTRA